MTETDEPRVDELAVVKIHEVSSRPGPYIDFADQIVNQASAYNLSFRHSITRMLRFDVDVVHLRAADVDRLLGARKSFPDERMELATTILRELEARGIGLVQTLDGRELTSASNDPVQHAFDRVTDSWVVLDEAAASPDPDRAELIPVAHFRERFVGYPRRGTVAGRLLHCSTAGSSTAATGLPGIPRATRTPDLAIRVVGNHLGDTAPEIVEAANHSDVVTHRLERLSDGALVQEITGAELILHPVVESFADWQVILVALSLNRPVLVPDLPAMRGLAEEVGPGWVHTHPNPATAEAVDGAIAAARSACTPAHTPDLSRREPRAVGQAYARLFRQVASAVGNTR